jgi:hypothetical protein
MTVQELRDLLTEAIAAGSVEADAEFSIGVDYGDEVILAEIDFVDFDNRAIVCSGWATADDTEFVWLEEPDLVEEDG